MKSQTATAIAHPNIALIKYWGNRDPHLRIPANGSISINLESLHAITTVTFKEGLKEDTLILNGKPQLGAALLRVRHFLDLVRQIAGVKRFANVTSENNFAEGAGIASSAAAFAALSVAATNALGLNLSEAELSRLARRGSGSACRSIPAGFVEWIAGNTDDDSYAVSLFPPSYWNLVDCVVVLNTKPKDVGSSEGHLIADTSPLQACRVEDSSRRLDICRKAIVDRDFDALAYVAELDSNWMHSVMLTSSPPLLYWDPATITVIKAVYQMRKENIPALYTIDAGPNVHILTLSDFTHTILQRIKELPHIQEILVSPPGGGAQLSSPLIYT